MADRDRDLSSNLPNVAPPAAAPAPPAGEVEEAFSVRVQKEGERKSYVVRATTTISEFREQIKAFVPKDWPLSCGDILNASDGSNMLSYSISSGALIVATAPNLVG